MHNYKWYSRDRPHEPIDKASAGVGTGDGEEQDDRGERSRDEGHGIVADEAQALAEGPLEVGANVPAMAADFHL